MNVSVKTRGGRALFAALVIFGTSTIVGCGSDEPEADSATARSGTVTELNDSGDCEGQDVLVNQDGVRIVLDGNCGTVTIAASGVSVDIDSSVAVVVSGLDTTVRGTQTGTLTVSGRSVRVAFDQVKHVLLNGNAATVMGQDMDRIDVSGSGNSLSFDHANALAISGNDNRAQAQSIGRMEVTGSNNSVAWDSGAAAPSLNTGSENRFNPPGD